MAITALPAVPVRTDTPANFVTKADTFLGSLPQFVTETNSLAAGLNSLATGGAFAIPYTFSTTITDADPGAGFLRLDNATQSSATVIRASVTDAALRDETATLASFTQSTSTIKGHIKLAKLNDPTKWIILSITALATPTGYRNITSVVVAASSSNPFVNGDSIVLYFQRTGDVGTSGTLALRSASITTGPAPAPNATTTDIYMVTALAEAPTFAAPTGSPSDGQGLLIRIKDNGTARALAWNAIYRGGGDLALPATTILSKTLYVGFRYNSADTKWDLVSVLNNI